MLDKYALNEFIRESNAIEGIHSIVTERMKSAHESILALDTITIPDLQRFVSAIQPGAVLRDRPGLDVRVGDYVAPQGGPTISERLRELLDNENTTGWYTPYDAHRRYEKLHPFTDGNGRSGRALWLWMHLRRGTYMGLGFLHQWYYESLR